MQGCSEVEVGNTSPALRAQARNIGSLQESLRVYGFTAQGLERLQVYDHDEVKGKKLARA